MLYKKHYQERIPSEGEGRRQRYRVGAVQVFRDLKKERMSKRAARQGKSTRQEQEAAPSLLTLTDIGQQTGISYPTLQRYVRLFGARIPSKGEGRKRRYHPSAVAVFQKLRAESKPGRKSKEEPAPPELLTLSAIGRLTGISGPTLQRYLKLEGELIPHEGEGRKRRYYPEAVAVFQELRSRSRRGPRAKGTAAEVPAPAVDDSPGEASAVDDSRDAVAAVDGSGGDAAPAPLVDDSGDGAARVAASDGDLPPAATPAVDDSGDDSSGAAVPAVDDSDVKAPEAAAATVDDTSGETPAAAAPAVLDSTDLEARLQALEDQVRLVLEKLEQPVTITLSR